MSAGKGTRMKMDTPKQFLSVGGKTILQRAIEPFEFACYIDEILVVTDQDFIPICNELCEGYSKVKEIIVGGKQRQDSVKNALEVVKDGYVLIHDGARPYVTADIIERVLEKTSQTGAVVPAVKVKDTIRQLKGDVSITPNRDELFSVQTPQGFETQVIKEAFQKAYSEGFYGTDDGSLVERNGHKVAIVEGSYQNIKITTKEDLPVEIRVGSGFDVHRLVEDRALILCGVDIPFEKGLLGHSDADVALHALMDAMLGAAALGDIGRHFPDTDEKYKDVSSMVLLQKVKEAVSEAGYTLNNADITIMAQRPNLLSYIQQMRKTIAEALQVEENAINIKATTTEKLGFVGREEGIAAEAVCILNKG